jgi:uncharacterized DUF497 family protein
MPFEWDDRKNAANIAKHGVGFALACRIFEGPVASWIDDRADYGEVRVHTIGMVDAVLVLAVIHTQRDGTCRIISARRANARERKRYEEAISARTDD